jgi:hypothetical protein
MALYTSMIIYSRKCCHVDDDCPIALHAPTNRKIREKKPYVIDDHKERPGIKSCSVCGAYVRTNGW